MPPSVRKRARAAWLGAFMLLAAGAAPAQFRPLRFEDDFGAQSVFADLRMKEHRRGFAQLASSIANGRAAGPSPVDENRLDPTNLFVEWRSAREGAGAFGIRVGIQELQFGSGRAIDAREGPNVRRSFEAVRA